jgi:membrane protein required for colicin V production
MHIYDLLMLGVLGLLAWSGYRRGFVREVAGLAAFVVGFVVALALAEPLARRLVALFPGLSATTAHVVALLAVVVLVGIVVDMAALFITAAISRVPLVGRANRLGGLLAGAALALLVIWLLTVCLLLLPPTLVPFTSGVRHSRTAQLVRDLPGTWSRDLRVHLTELGVPPGAR